MATTLSSFAATLLSLLLQTAVSGGPVATEFLYPNFTASNILFVDTSGVFLTSRNSTFQAAVDNPGRQQSSFYLSIIHTATNTIVWSANRNSPISNSALITLTPSGLTISNSNNSIAWSTPPLQSPVHSLHLLDTGNLLLLDAANSTLWQSFDHPTDTLLSSQRLPAGSAIISSVSNTDLSEGNYRLLITPGDAVMQWAGAQTYWSLSTDARSVKDYNSVVSYMVATATGLYLVSSTGKTIFSVPLPQSTFRSLTLDSSGRLQINDEFTAPTADCDLPFPCKSLGLCNPGSACSCPVQFTPGTDGCSPGDGSTVGLVASCVANTGPDSPVSYQSLGSRVGYFANKFASPTSSGEGLTDCRARCSSNCSYLGFFYVNTSKSCYLIENHIGSLTSSSSVTNFGFIKTIAGEATAVGVSSSSKIRTVAVLLPSIAAFLLVGVLISVVLVWWRRAKRRRFGVVVKEIQLGRSWGATADGELSDEEEILIPGLPARFSYAELEVATGGFRTKIGSGGFGTVYKGTLPDKTIVAVKRIGGISVQGRREFCTEIAVIGNVRHVNLVRLRGFCAEGARRVLVYEYMDRGSLDRPLFGLGPVLEWEERVEIAVGAARGLAYLHSGCDYQIVHCDVKPENILLGGGGQVKIADFGLAKLLSPEQSGLFTTMRGTRGYLAPEWLTNSAISDKTDVYSFGMVLLEIVRGSKNRPQEAAVAAVAGYFPMVALEMHVRGRYMGLADPRLEGRVTGEEVGRMVRVALCCLHEEAGLRPSMAAVAGMLEGTVEVWEPRVELLGFLKLYGRASAIGPGDDASGFVGIEASGSSSATTSGFGSFHSSQQISGPR